MSTDNKVLKIAGKDPGGLAKGIKVREDGGIIASDGAKILKINEGTLAAGAKTSPLSALTEGRPCRVFAFISPSSVPWELVITAKYLDKEDPNGNTSSNRKVLSAFDDSIERHVYVTSDGSQKLVNGYGGRASGWTELTESVVSGLNYQLTNKSSSESFDYQLIVVSYPHEVLVEEQLKLLNKKYAQDSDAPVINEYSEIVSEDVELTASDSAVIYESSGYTRVEHLNIASSDGKQPTIRIQPKNPDGSLQGPISIGNGNTGRGSHTSLETLIAFQNSLFDVVQPSGGATIVSLNRYMTFPNGVQISVTTTASLPANLYCGIRGYFVRRD